jgi:hypothetical protein
MLENTLDTIFTIAEKHDVANYSTGIYMSGGRSYHELSPLIKSRCFFLIEEEDVGNCFLLIQKD